MRARWGLWKQLKGRETGLGWDPEKGTISATDEWWDLKIKENPKFVAFREEGFEFELETKIDQIFGCYSQGSLKFNPLFDSPQGHLQHESDEVYVPSPPCNDTPHVDLGDMDETHGDDNDYNTWDDVWKESIPTPQDTQFERSEKSRDSALSNGVVCPKPRRVGGFFNSPSAFDPLESIRPSCYLQFSQQMEACDSDAGTELLDIILAKGDYGEGRSNYQMDSSPPFFCGSPPSRASNPLIQDAHFGQEFFDPFSPTLEANGGGGCGMKFGHKPAPVRIEGFSCGRNCSISAVA
nr:uncharacterized protein LOC109184191 isoform X2 [Ipomoea trifida]